MSSNYKLTIDLAGEVKGFEGKIEKTFESNPDKCWTDACNIFQYYHTGTDKDGTSFDTFLNYYISTVLDFVKIKYESKYAKENPGITFEQYVENSSKDYLKGFGNGVSLLDVDTGETL